MTLTKQQTEQINSVNPEILKLGEEVKEERKESPHQTWEYGTNKFLLRYESTLSGILSQCKSELEFLTKVFGEEFEETEGLDMILKNRISALKVTIQFLEGVLK